VPVDNVIPVDHRVVIGEIVIGDLGEGIHGLTVDLTDQGKKQHHGCEETGGREPGSVQDGTV